MSVFLALAAGLVVLLIGMVAWPLWRGGSRALALAVALVLPLAAAAIYHLKGQPEALDPQLATAPASVEDAVAQLEKRLAADPGNFEGTALLARSYMALERFDEASATYARALALKPGDTDLSVEYAEAMLRAAPDRRFPPKAVALLEKAVAANPNNQRALFFLGLQRRQAERPAEAAQLWERLLPMLEPAAAGELRKQVDEARTAAGLPALPPMVAAAPATGAASDAGLDVEVTLDPALAKSMPPGAVLFVFARSTEGRGPPFAAKRVEPGSWPLRLRLSDADSPMPAALLSTQSRVQVMARLSAAGAQGASGDLESTPVEADPHAGTGVTLVLDQRRP